MKCYNKKPGKATLFLMLNSKVLRSLALKKSLLLILILIFLKFIKILRILNSFPEIQIFFLKSTVTLNYNFFSNRHGKYQTGLII